jgi:hypothetical protein
MAWQGFDETWYDVTERIDEIVAREEEEKGPATALPTPVGHVYTPPNSTDSCAWFSMVMGRLFVFESDVRLH